MAVWSNQVKFIKGKWVDMWFCGPSGLRKTDTLLNVGQGHKNSSVMKEEWWC